MMSLEHLELPESKEVVNANTSIHTHTHITHKTMPRNWEYDKAHRTPKELQSWDNLNKIKDIVLDCNPKCKIRI